MFRTLAPALVAPLLLASACATEADQRAVQVDTGAVAVDAVRDAPDAAAGAGTAAFEMVMTITGAPGLGEDGIELVASGEYDADAGQMSMQMDLGAMLEKLAESTDEPLPPGIDEPMELVADGATFYMRIPMLGSLTGGPTWFSMSPEDVGLNADALGLGVGTYDPAQLLDVLRGTTDDVEAVGQEEVRGVPTTRYTATVSAADALEEVPADAREELEAQLDQLGADDARFPVEVWVDADGLPRRVQMTVDDLAGLGDDAHMTMTLEYFDYGASVDIEVPSADDVVSFGEVLNDLGGFGAEGS